MNRIPEKLLYVSVVFIFLCGCKEEKKELPPLTYTGENPRIQDPLSPEDSRRHIQVPEGFEAVLFAAEPDIINPNSFAWDEKGHLWVVQSLDYPHGLENEVGGDRITICEDTNGDGKADKFIDFATGQRLSTGIVIVKGGAIVAQAPEIVLLEDTDGDDKMDKRTVLLDGFGIWDTHAGPSSLRWGLDNLVWGSVGYAGFENQFGGKEVNFGMGVYRFTRDGKYFEPVGQFNNNTWGLGITQNFEIFGSTANNNHSCFVGIPLRHYDYLDKRPSWAVNADFIQGHYEITKVGDEPLQQVDVRGGYTAAAGANFYTAENYPEMYRNQMYVNEPTGHVVHIAKIEEDGAGYQEVDGGNIFASTDAWTAPVFSETGPDGNLWVADWYNPVIQHNPDKRGMDNQIWNAEGGKGNAHLNPHRDKRHGRIYVLKHENDLRQNIQELNSDNIEGLLDGLKSRNMFWRTTAQRLIVENNIQELASALIELAELDELESNTSIHVLWTLKGLGALNGENAAASALITKGLKSKSEGVQRASLSLLPITEAGSGLLINSDLLRDENLRIRLAAILLASELPETDELYKIIKGISNEMVNTQDKWLKAAIKIYFREQNNEEINPEDVTMVIPSAEEEITEWHYTENEPPNNWYSPGFDDADWKVGLAAFGTKDLSPGVSSLWSSPNIWMRKEVILAELTGELVLKVAHDENYKVYVNGQLVAEEKGRSLKYKFRPIDNAKALFKKGRNVIAVYCVNEQGAQYIDIGIGKIGEFEADRKLVLNTVSQKMAYDKKVLQATAGQYLEIELNNKDQMPHNLVLIEEGSLEAFGNIVDKFLQDPEAANMEYVPKSRYVLASTKMLDPGERAIIRLKVPDKPGEYPFICTFPGHWRIMQGVLVVSPRGTYVSEDKNAPKVAVMGGGGSHDFLKFFGEADGKVMSRRGKVTVNYTENTSDLRTLIVSSDVLVISNNKPLDIETRETIFSRVNQGMPMLIYHPSTWYNWEDWPAYNKELLGGGSRSHEKLQEFEVKVIKPNHPIMKNVPATFRIVDELYRWEQDKEGTDIEVLAIGKGLESGAEFPVVWVVKHRKAKIVGNTLGHDQDAHGLPAYQTILSNSLEWVKNR